MTAPKPTTLKKELAATVQAASAMVKATTDMKQIKKMVEERLRRESSFQAGRINGEQAPLD